MRGAIWLWCGMPKTRRILYQHLCFHAQQAAEKALKAVLVAKGVRFPEDA